MLFIFFFFFSSRRRHTRFDCDWSSDVCSSDLLCHGPDGRGDGPAAASLAVKPPDLAEHFFHHREGDILWKLKHGAPDTPMPAFGGRLSEEQLWELITLLRARAEAQAGRALNESVEDSRAIAAPEFTFQVGREPQASLARQPGAVGLLVVHTL